MLGDHDVCSPGQRVVKVPEVELCGPGPRQGQRGGRPQGLHREVQVLRDQACDRHNQIDNKKNKYTQQLKDFTNLWYSICILGLLKTFNNFDNKLQAQT